MKFHYAIDRTNDVVYRFDCPSDASLWCAYSSRRYRVLATHPLVVRAKAAVERGAFDWPQPNWREQE